MKTLIAVPMKDPALCKTRLADSLSTEARKDLARLLYRRTLDFLAPLAEDGATDVAVVTGEGEAADVARSCGMQVITEDAPGSLINAVETASAWACAQGYDRLCVIPADLVAPIQNDLRRFLNSTAAVTICPSSDQGTNALLVSPPDAISFHYGPRSALAHFSAAERAGLTPVLMPLASLSFDLDHSSCLNRAMTIDPEIKAVCQ